MKIGIVGMPNAGKSSLFNALTRAGAQAANYPFTTVEPNVAVVPVPDERLERVAATIGARPVVHETIEFHDIAGLVRGAHQGEGLGNKFLANIRETVAILRRARARRPAGCPSRGRVDPLADAETIETELLFADLDPGRAPARARGQAGKVARQGRHGRGALAARYGRTRCARRAGRSVRSRTPRRGHHPPLSPHLQARAHRGEHGEATGSSRRRKLAAHAEKRGARAAASRARLDSELAGA